MTSDQLQKRLNDSLGANRDVSGSILYRLTWKTRITPSGRPICAQRASAWRGTKAKKGNGYEGPFTIVPIPWRLHNFLILPVGLATALWERADDISANVSTLSGWTTPQAHDTSGRSESQKAKHGTKHGCACLVLDAKLSGWTTATERDHKDTPGMVAERANGKSRDDPLPRQAYLAGWSTAKASDGTGGRTTETKGGGNVHLDKQARLVGPMRLTAENELLTGSIAGMESGGQLSPEHSRWLMTLPPEWANCVPMVTRSTRKRRRAS